MGHVIKIRIFPDFTNIFIQFLVLLIKQETYACCFVLRQCKGINPFRYEGSEWEIMDFPVSLHIFLIG